MFAVHERRTPSPAGTCAHQPDAGPEYPASRQPPHLGTNCQRLPNCGRIDCRVSSSWPSVGGARHVICCALPKHSSRISLSLAGFVSFRNPYGVDRPPVGTLCDGFLLWAGPSWNFGRFCRRPASRLIFFVLEDSPNRSGGDVGLLFNGYRINLEIREKASAAHHISRQACAHFLRIRHAGAGDRTVPLPSAASDFWRIDIIHRLEYLSLGAAPG